MEDAEENPTKYQKIEDGEEEEDEVGRTNELRPFRFGEIGDIYYDNRCYDLWAIYESGNFTAPFKWWSQFVEFSQSQGSFHSSS